VAIIDNYILTLNIVILVFLYSSIGVYDRNNKLESLCQNIVEHKFPTAKSARVCRGVLRVWGMRIQDSRTDFGAFLRKFVDSASMRGWCKTGDWIGSLQHEGIKFRYKTDTCGLYVDILAVCLFML
jgi:hypothetical protein